jgi:hypothetical protein
MQRNLLMFLAVLVLAIAGILYLQKNGKDITPTNSTIRYKNIGYIFDGRAVTLMDGYAEEEIAPDSATKLITQYFGNEVKGDLNGDGKDDVAFLVTQSAGGSGTYYYVVAALKVADSYIGTNAIYLGDRIAPQTTEIHDGKLVVNYADRAPLDSMTTQPSIGVSRYLVVDSTQLVEIQ